MSDSVMNRSKLLLTMEFWIRGNCIGLSFSIVEDMGKRIDDLERNIAHIISQTNAELP